MEIVHWMGHKVRECFVSVFANCECDQRWNCDFRCDHTNRCRRAPVCVCVFVCSSNATPKWDGIWMGYSFVIVCARILASYDDSRTDTMSIVMVCACARCDVVFKFWQSTFLSLLAMFFSCRRLRYTTGFFSFRCIVHSARIFSQRGDSLILARNESDTVKIVEVRQW